MDSRHEFCHAQQIGQQIDAEIGQRKAQQQRSELTGAQDSKLDAGRQLDYVDASRFVTLIHLFRVVCYPLRHNRPTKTS